MTVIADATAQLTTLKDDARTQALRNNKGKITKAHINKRLKIAADSEEVRLLNDYIASDKAIKDSTKTAKELRATAYSSITEQLVTEPDNEELGELRVLTEYLTTAKQIDDLKGRIKQAEADLDALAYAKYPKLTEFEIKTLVVDDKWFAALDIAINGEMDRVSQQLTQRVKELAERYETPLPQMANRVSNLEAKVNGHLNSMGFT